jgi:hypothetical protein
MIGIQAMSVIANLTGHSDDAAHYSSIAHDYIAKWQSLAIAKDANPPHTTLSYGDNSSHGKPDSSNIPYPIPHTLTLSPGLLYNLFADAQLGLGLVPDYVYQMQSNFYPTVANKYGVPLDTRHTYTKGDWECFSAAVASTSTRSTFLKDLATWVNETPTNRALTDLYDTITGKYVPPFYPFTQAPANVSKLPPKHLRRPPCHGWCLRSPPGDFLKHHIRFLCIYSYITIFLVGRFPSFRSFSQVRRHGF